MLNDHQYARELRIGVSHPLAQMRLQFAGFEGADAGVLQVVQRVCSAAAYRSAADSVAGAVVADITRLRG